MPQRLNDIRSRSHACTSCCCVHTVPMIPNIIERLRAAMFAAMPYLILGGEITADTRIPAQGKQKSLRSFCAPKWNRDDEAQTWLGWPGLGPGPLGAFVSALPLLSTIMMHDDSDQPSRYVQI